MIRTQDGTQTKRIPGPGDRSQTYGYNRPRACYTAVGGETTITISSLVPALSYNPGKAQISVKRSSGGGDLLSGTDFYETSSTVITFPSGDPLIAGEIVEITLESVTTGVMAVAPRPDCYTTTATALQTVVIADFSWTYNLNPTKSVGGVKVYVQGSLWKRGVEYTEVNLGTTNTNQILVADGFIGGEDIVILPAYQAIDTSAASSSLANQSLANLQSMAAAGTQGFVDQSEMISVPNTTIVGRAKIPNLANDLRPSFGIERIMTPSIVLLQDEFGASGEQVYSTINDTRGLIRFVGSTWTNLLNADGQCVLSTASGEYIEIVFYGSNLNIMVILNSSNRDMRATIDGGTEGANFLPQTVASIYDGRNYNKNIVVNVPGISSLGLHTVKLKSYSSNIACNGFEILNDNASGLVNINPGTGYLNGQKYINSLVDSIAYNTGVTGTRGGRIVRYLNADGTVGQVFTPVDAAAAYLTSADHTNEEVVRTHHWREFGAGRTDDFSSLPAGNNDAAFTLDDGTTVLSGIRIGNTGNIIDMYDNSSVITLTFVGTGIDIGRCDTGSSGTFIKVYYIDGVSIGTETGNNSTILRNLKVASGLPYGTHTLKITRTAVTSADSGVVNFTIYQPKKPILPSTALELCDYNVMATFVANTLDGGSLGSIATGVLRKSSFREMTCIGTWSGGVTINAGGVVSPGGYLSSTTSGDVLSYTFFGTGFDLRFYHATAGGFVIAVDGLSNFTSYGNGYYGAAGTWTPSTGTFSGDSGGRGCGIWISGLALGKHTVTLTKNSTNPTQPECLDIITPIHAVKSNLYADLQNTLPVGSCSLMDSRKTSMIKEILPAQKAWAQAVGITSGPTNNVTSVALPVPDMSLSIKTNGGPVQINFSIQVAGSLVANVFWSVYVDGIVIREVLCDAVVVTMQALASLSMIAPVSAGTHKVDIYWRPTGGTINSYSTGRVLTVKEL